MIPLSILDLSVVTTGTKPAAALRNSIDLACHADALGYVRYWLAEHHNLASVASPAPDLMIGQIAAVTSRIRVGSGGVMLPNHAPLVIAERFKMLEALFPGRRAPTAPPRMRCAAGSTAARATISWSGCRN
jgi:luciferase family oxidoreductase group 1